VLFVTAHPDDEAMFFIPTIETLKQQHYILHLLCLSNGNAANLGKLREDELMKCCKFLGISKVKIIDDPEVQDGMNVKWPKKKLQLIISS
jgi:N-acetylglucosaminylphosphatidylinositol deacetylase